MVELKGGRVEILISNDDGVYSEGIKSLRKFLSQIAKVTVVAPLEERSTTGHTLTLDQPLRLIELEEDVGNLKTRVQMQDESLLSVKSELMSSISNIQQTVGSLQSGQKAIIDNARNKEKILAKQRKLEEQRIKREGAEKSLEEGGTDDKDSDNKGEEAGKKAKKSIGILDRLKQFLTFVVAGWFTDKTFK